VKLRKSARYLQIVISKLAGVRHRRLEIQRARRWIWCGHRSMRAGLCKRKAGAKILASDEDVQKVPVEFGRLCFMCDATKAGSVGRKYNDEEKRHH